MHSALQLIFERFVSFRLENGTPIDGGVFIGGTEFLPVEVLKDDPDAYQAEFNNWITESGNRSRRNLGIRFSNYTEMQNGTPISIEPSRGARSYHLSGLGCLSRRACRLGRLSCGRYGGLPVFKETTWPNSFCLCI